MASLSDARYPDPSDIIAIKWQHTQTTEQVKVQSITQHSITLQYLDNNDIEELQLEDGHLPFEWQLLEKHDPSHTHDIQLQSTQESLPLQQQPTQIDAINALNAPLYNNDTQFYSQDQYYNKGSRWQPKSKQSHESDDNNTQFKDKHEYFQRKRQRYDQSHPSHPKEQPQIQTKPKMKRKEVPQHRSIARSLSTVTATTITDKTSTDYTTTQDYSFNEATNAIHLVRSARLPLKGDIVEISYAGGAQNDPVRIIHSNFQGDARVRYTDARGAESSVNFINNNDITFKIKHSVYSSPDIEFIPAPRKGDTVEIRWVGDGGRDIVHILDVEAQYTEEYERNKNEKKVDEFKEDAIKQDINHYDKFTSIWVTFEYPDDSEREKIDFHPNAVESEILTWKILKCGNTAGLDIGDDVKMDELDNEICTVCCTSFKEFPYRTVVPCAHNNVCAKCTLRMRVFGDFNNDKHPYPMCPFCKESWEIVAFVPVSWTISINNIYKEEDSPQNILSRNEWNIVFQRPLEYDDEIQCYFTDIDLLQQFIHIRSLYCLLCCPPNRVITDYSKLFYFHNVGKLLAHLRQNHTSFMCELCLNNATLFMDEQRIFMNNKKLLIDHQRNGSALQGQYGETAPHPFCTLCRRNFYSREALYEHCEDSHCWCLLCKQSGILEYYANNDILTEHHRNLHHLCEHKECLAKLQPVVFDDPILLKSHQMQVHRMNKPVHAVRTAFTYGDDIYEKHSNGTMNFSTMFTQSDINYLSAARYGSNVYQANDAQNMNNISDEQRARHRQKELHRTMDQIKQRWFPNSFQREQQQLHKKRQALQLGLKHIPVAVPNEQREEKNTLVIKQIRKILISEFNFKQFQVISHSYKINKISSSVFFHRFKNLFDALCDESIWVDILIQMLALLRDGKNRRALYEEYRDWIIGGRVNKTTKIRSRIRPKPLRTGGIASNASKKAVKSTVPSLASVVAGRNKKVTKEMIMSQRRAQRTRNARNNNAIPSIQKKQPSSPPNVKGKWKTGAPQLNKPKHKMKAANIPKITAKTPAVKQHWPTLAPAKAAPKAPPKWVEEALISPPIQQTIFVVKENHKKKKTKRGPRKGKKNKENAIKKVDVVDNIELKVVEAKPQEPPKAKPQPIKTPKGFMPHENKAKNKKTFNKSNPWGALPKSPQRMKPITKEKKVKKQKQHKDESKQKAIKTYKKPIKKPQNEDNKINNNNSSEQKQSECYFDDLNDAKSELQRVFVKLSSYKKTLYLNDKIGLFLVFLFECLYCIFEFNFDAKMSCESVELSKAWRQHIYQSVYEQFWSKKKDSFDEDKERKKIKISKSSYKIRINDNMLSWNPFLYKLPALNENSATQFGALYDMLAVIDDEMDMTPLKAWIDQMELRFDETYCLLLYLWFILDIEIPSAPYPFIQVPSIIKDKNNKNKAKQQSPKKAKQKQKQKHKQQQQHHHHNNNKKKGGNKKKPKSKPVVLFKMGGM